MTSKTASPALHVPDEVTRHGAEAGLVAPVLPLLLPTRLKRLRHP